MNHDDAFSNSVFDLPDQVTKSTAIEPVTDIDLAIEQAKSPTGSLAAIQDFQANQASVEQSQSLVTPVVDNFLPSPNRLLALSGLGLVGALGIGALASTFITYNTTVKAQAVVQPVGDIQPIESAAGGVVESIFVQEHDTLAPDQEIAEFKNVALQKEVEQIEAQIAGTEERITQVNGQLQALDQRRLAEASWLRQLTEAGLSSGGGSQFTYSQNRLFQHRNELETRLGEERNQLAQVHQQIENLTVRAPKAGNIYDLQLRRLGQTVSANETIAKIVSDKTGLEIKALVPDNQIENIEIGHPTKMNLSECAFFRFGSLEGQVSSVEPVQPDLEINIGRLKTAPKNSHMVTIKTAEQDLQANSRTCELLPGMQG
nr:HlyD family efflux transporter periplasmic adaptor subunit [Leptolyngbyaceae cyanobacterium MAG.088]